MDMHGEAALVASYRPATVLDAGCGTGRVAIELARRGHDVVGVDVDPAMLEAARAKAPGLTWIEADLTDPALDLGRTFDVVVMAGNVLIFVPSGTEAQVIANTARHVVSGWPPRRRLLPSSRRAPAFRPRCPRRAPRASSSRTAGPPGTAAPVPRPTPTPSRCTEAPAEAARAPTTQRRRAWGTPSRTECADEPRFVSLWPWEQRN